MAENDAPYMFLYFDATSEFKGSVICADGCKIFVHSCVSNALLAYLALYHACEVGFHRDVFLFMSLLEHMCLHSDDEKFPNDRYKPIKLEKFLQAKVWK